MVISKAYLLQLHSDISGIFPGMMTLLTHRSQFVSDLGFHHCHFQGIAFLNSGSPFWVLSSTDGNAVIKINQCKKLNNVTNYGLLQQ